MEHSLLGLTDYLKYFVGLIALVNPIGILPVFMSMTNGQSEEFRNKTNRTANMSVFIILTTALFLGDSILKSFGITIDSFRIAGGILVSAVAMSMINGKLGEDKQNKQEKSESVLRENIGVVPLAMPLLAGPAAISSTIVWGAKYNSLPNMLGLMGIIACFAFSCWLLFRSAPLLVRLLGQTGINVITRIMGLLLLSLGIELIVAGMRALFPGLL